MNAYRVRRRCQVKVPLPIERKVGFSATCEVCQWDGPLRVYEGSAIKDAQLHVLSGDHHDREAHKYGDAGDIGGLDQQARDSQSPHPSSD